MLIADDAKLELPEGIEKGPLLHLIMAFHVICNRHGFKKAPETISRALLVSLAKAKSQCVIVYMEDIVMFSRTPEKHIHHARQGLAILKDPNVILIFKKCFFFKICIVSHGPVIRPEPLEGFTLTINAICRLRHPTNMTELRSFLSLCNVFRPFAQHFANIAPLSKKKLFKDQLQTFDVFLDEEINALKTL